MAEEQQATSNSEPAARPTTFYDTAGSFASARLLGHVFRMYAECPEFKALDYCWYEGVSILILPDGTGRLVISKIGSQAANDGGSAVRHATMPLRLKGANYEAQRQVGIELVEFIEQCTIYGEPGSSSASEAQTIIQDFACEILGGEDEWDLKLYPCLGGHTFRYQDQEDGEVQTILASDIMMTTPNCDELGHFFFRPTEAAVSAETVDAVLAEEVAAWDAILNPPPLSAGDRIRTRLTFPSGNEGGGNLVRGLVGTVMAIDEDGDANVDFGADTGSHWVYKPDHRKLERIAEGTLAEP